MMSEVYYCRLVKFLKCLINQIMHILIALNKYFLEDSIIRQMHLSSWELKIMTDIVTFTIIFISCFVCQVGNGKEDESLLPL